MAILTLASETLGFSTLVAYTLASIGDRVVCHATDCILDWLLGRISVSITVDSRDEAFRWMVDWMAEEIKKRPVSDYHLHTSFAQYGFREDSLDVETTDSPPLMLSPATGTHWLVHGGKYVRISRSRGANEGNFVRESLTMRMFFCGAERIKLLLQEAQRDALRKNRKMTTVYAPDHYGNWVKSTCRTKRALDSVILEPGLKEELLKDVNEYLKGSRWYQSRGIPWRRGYLLEGPPGCGKTSFATALAGELDMSIYCLNLNSQVLTDEMLLELLSATPVRCMLLLEDMEAAMSDDNRNDCRLTRSGILNAIDGVAAIEGRVLVMTTNFPEVLGEGFVRPGRIDIRKHFSKATTYHALEMFRVFFPDMDQYLYHSIRKTFQDGEVSLATLQGHLMRFRGDATLAVEQLPHLFQNKVN